MMINVIIPCAAVVVIVVIAVYVALKYDASDK